MMGGFSREDFLVNGSPTSGECLRVVARRSTVGHYSGSMDKVIQFESVASCTVGVRVGGIAPELRTHHFEQPEDPMNSDTAAEG